MTDFQEEKRTVLDYFSAMDSADVSEIPDVVSSFTTSDYVWRGYHPFGELHGAEQVANRFWQPLRSSLKRLQRRNDIFFAGMNEMDGYATRWVVTMGHLVGLLDGSWLGIVPNRKMSFLRYCSFDRITGGRIAETAMFFDIPHLMIQAGYRPFDSQTGSHLVQPGPITHDGLLLERQDAEEGRATLAAINAMISDLGNWNLGLPLEEELARTWHDDMIWWGPAGIGATYTISRYAEQHAGPFRSSMADRSRVGHIARLAEGHYGGFFGWPNFTAVHRGGLMGMPATNRVGEFRVIDIYRRSGDLLAENWVFIDMLHYWKQQGIDILADMNGVREQ